MRARSKATTDTLSTAVNAALASPARGLGGERARLEGQLGTNLTDVQVHRGVEVDGAAERLGARGFALGRHVALAAKAAPETLTHEVAHAVQQGLAEPAAGDYRIAPPGNAAECEATRAAGRGGDVSRGHALRIQRDLVSPGRLGDVHQGVRVEGPSRSTPPGGTPQRRKPWVDPSGGKGGTAAVLYKQAYNFLDNRTFKQPKQKHTTSANLDADAVAMNQRVLAHFPRITSALSDAEIQTRVGLMQPSVVAKDNHFLNEWMDNFLDQMSDSEDYDIDPTNAAYRAMITRLINNSRVGPKIVQLASRQSAFARGEGTSREIFVHPRVKASKRQTTLIHEIVHLYRHARYRDWVHASRDFRHYNEGLTEWLARKVMTPAERSNQKGYQGRVDTVQRQIGQHVSEDGIARAFFQGEVWRLETRSAEARAAFETTTGIREGSAAAVERKASQTGSGIFQTVVPGEHYRFLNLGFSEAQPKDEHKAAFREVKTRSLDPNPGLKLRFVGHASSPGSDAANMEVARRRSVAFYHMARVEGMPWNRMLDADRPPHFGESRATVTEEDAITRAMNRRVEMFLVQGGGP